MLTIICTHHSLSFSHHHYSPSMLLLGTSRNPHGSLRSPRTVSPASKVSASPNFGGVTQDPAGKTQGVALGTVGAWVGEGWAGEGWLRLVIVTGCFLLIWLVSWVASTLLCTYPCCSYSFVAFFVGVHWLNPDSVSLINDSLIYVVCTQY